MFTFAHTHRTLPFYCASSELLIQNIWLSLYSLIISLFAASRLQFFVFVLKRERLVCKLIFTLLLLFVVAILEISLIFSCFVQENPVLFSFFVVEILSLNLVWRCLKSLRISRSHLVSLSGLISNYLQT